MTTPSPARLTREELDAQRRAKRREDILSAAIFLAERHGYRSIQRDAVADAADVAVGSVNHEFGTIEELKNAVVAEAIRVENLKIIAQAVVDGHPETAGLSPDLKRRALDSLAV